jgi:sulfur-carrier protein
LATLRFTTHLLRHRDVRALQAPGATLAAVLQAGLADDPLLRSYVLDDQGRLRKHVTVYIDGAPIRDRLRLGDPVGPESEIYVMQALSGG